MNYSSSLKEYLEFYSQFGIDEISIVEKYISDKHLESDFSDMVIRLTADNLRKEKEKMSRAISASETIGHSYLGSYTKEENKFLDKLTRNLAFYPETCLSYYGNEIKEKIPNMLMPDICYINLIALINYKYKVKFKNQIVDIQFLDDYYKKLADMKIWEEEHENEDK